MGFELGVNYWPRRAAMSMWRELDLGLVRDELAHIRDLGAGVVRFFALAEDFLPAPDEVPTEKVAALVEVARAAEDAGLRAVPTLVVINMSGRMWWPPWLRGRDLYRDPAALAAQARLAAAVGAALAGSAAVRAIDLTNELDDAQAPAARADVARWAATLAGAVREAAPGIPIQVGLHLASLTRADAMRVDDVGAVADEDCMHAYPLYEPAARGPLDPELCAFACALTSELAGRGRPTLMQEFGLSTAPPGEPGRMIEDDFLGAPRAVYLASEEEGARYLAGVLERLVATGASGAYVWCYADYDPALFDRPPLDRALRERSFGLVRADGSEKPAAAELRRAARRLETGELAPGPRPELLDLDSDDYHRDPRPSFARLYAGWPGWAR